MVNFGSLKLKFLMLSAVIQNNNISDMNMEKKLVQLFRTFVEKALVPQIRKAEGSLGEWHKFSALLSTENINFSELQLYVDTLNPNYTPSVDKQNQMKKR